MQSGHSPQYVDVDTHAEVALSNSDNNILQSIYPRHPATGLRCFSLAVETHFPYLNSENVDKEIRKNLFRTGTGA